MRLSDEIIDKLNIADWGYVEGPFPKSFLHYQKWVESEKHVPLNYLSDHRFIKRSDLRLYYPEYASALVFIFPYYEEKKQQDSFYKSEESNSLKIASFALSFGGEDYHHVISEKLNKIGESLQTIDPTLEYRLTLDVHPVLERDLAYRAGLGWFGKNSMLIHKKEGSFFMIGSILLNKKIEQRQRELEADHCGNCRACVDVCPTGAIDVMNRQIIANKCISTYTIETFQNAPEIPGHVDKGTGEIFGCDLCQDICPWNRKILKQELREGEKWPHQKKAKLLVDNFLKPPVPKVLENLQEMSKREFRRVFKGTSLERTGRDGLIKNISIFMKSDHDS